MLGDKDAIATVAVKDVKVAGKFYEGTLGLKPIPTGESGVFSYTAGNVKNAWFKDPDGNILSIVQVKDK